MMKSVFTIFLLCAIAIPFSLFSQGIPDESPNSIIKQKIGLNYVTISYGRPGVKNRNIMGELVPYGKVWRTGANYPTFIELNDTSYISIDSHKIPPGKYAIYSIPNKDEWTIILSKNTKLWGAFGYNENDDLLRFKVKPQRVPFTETFSIEFTELKNSSAQISLKWERTSVTFPLHFKIHEKVVEYIKHEITTERKNEAGLYRKGARYLLRENIHQHLAYEWASKSVELDSNWLNLWCKAEILAWMSNYKMAIQTGNHALENGLSDEQVKFFPYEKSYTAKLNQWKVESEK